MYILKENYSFFLSFVFFISFFGCSKNAINQELTDEDFIESISNEDLRASITKIDSLIDHGDFSNHRRAILFFEKGRLFANLEKDVEAIGSLKEALYLFKEGNNKSYLAKTNNLLGDSYAFLSKLDTATTHTKVAHDLFQEIGYKEGEAKTLNSLGHLSFLNQDFSASISYVKEAIMIQEELNDLERLSASYNNLGYILEVIEDYDQAILYYQEAVQINTEVERSDSNALRNLGAVYLRKKDIQKSNHFYKMALKIEEENDQFLLQKEIYDELISNSFEEKKYDDVASYIEKKDSVSQLLSIYDTNEKEKLINAKYEQFIAQENLKQELEINNKNRIILASLVGLLLVLGLFFFQRSKTSRLLLEQEKLVLEQKMLRTQMNPHFIFNALTAIQSTIFDNDPLKVSSYLSRFAKLIRQNFEFVSKNEITMEDELDALENYLKTQQLRFNHKFKYTIKVEEDLLLLKIPPMFLQPFVENAIEHGLRNKTKNGRIQIKVSKEKEHLKFLVLDNGSGYTYAKKKNPHEHAIDVFIKRLKLRNKGEEKLFSIEALKDQQGTVATVKLLLA